MDNIKTKKNEDFKRLIDRYSTTSKYINRHLMCFINFKKAFDIEWHEDLLVASSHGEVHYKQNWLNYYKISWTATLLAQSVITMLLENSLKPQYVSHKAPYYLYHSSTYFLKQWRKRFYTTTRDLSNRKQKPQRSSFGKQDKKSCRDREWARRNRLSLDTGTLENYLQWKYVETNSERDSYF